MIELRNLDCIDDELEKGVSGTVTPEYLTESFGDRRKARRERASDKRGEKICV